MLQHTRKFEVPSGTPFLTTITTKVRPISLRRSQNHRETCATMLTPTYHPRKRSNHPLYIWSYIHHGPLDIGWWNVQHATEFSLLRIHLEYVPEINPSLPCPEKQMPWHHYFDSQPSIGKNKLILNPNAGVPKDFANRQGYTTLQ